MNADHYLSRFRAGLPISDWSSELVTCPEILAQARKRDADPKAQRSNHEEGLLCIKNGGTLREAGRIWGVGPERARQIFWKTVRLARAQKKLSQKV